MSAALDQLEQTLCANERQGVLIETIDEKLHYALDSMPAGKRRDDEIRTCWLLLWTAREAHDRLHKQFGDAHEGILAERGAS
ncbi:MAG: hypothetical protein J0H88_13770 [Sphingomonadales bacterium]|nr:hypothetical protein [Sphingomonadales bacterium]